MPHILQVSRSSWTISHQPTGSSCWFINVHDAYRDLINWTKSSNRFLSGEPIDMYTHVLLIQLTTAGPWWLALEWFYAPRQWPGLQVWPAPTGSSGQICSYLCKISSFQQVVHKSCQLFFGRVGLRFVVHVRNFCLCVNAGCRSPTNTQALISINYDWH